LGEGEHAAYHQGMHPIKLTDPKHLTLYQPDDGEENPCAERWHNMVNDMTSRMWSVYEETGIVASLCRHGFVLIICDMVRSGEL
jgi:hypothetical protein